MSTYMAKKENVDRKWYVIDAAGVPLGKTAVKAANILRGKNKPEFTPNVDCGDFVIIINASKAVLTGRKLEQKYYYHHSGYIKGMLPHNSIGDKAITRLKVYAGEQHKQQAQKPETLAD